MAADSENEKNIEDAKERIHNLLDDAFSLLGTSPRTKKQAKEKVYEEIEVEKTEAGLQQAPPESETERSRYPGSSLNSYHVLCSAFSRYQSHIYPEKFTKHGFNI